MSTVEQRSERTARGSEWLPPHRARALRAKLREAAAMLLKTGQAIIDQEQIIARQRQAAEKADEIIERLLAERVELGRDEAEA